MPKRKPSTVWVSNPLRAPVVPSDDLRMVILKAREEMEWQHEDGKVWRLLRRMADELEARL